MAQSFGLVLREKHMKTKHPYNKQAKWTGGFFLAFVIGMTIWAGFLLNNYYISLSK